MKYKKYGNIYLVRIDKGEEIISTLREFCHQNQIFFGKISGIGATDYVTIGLFDPGDKQYHSATFQENFEILTLNGNVTSMKDQVYLHCHITLANEQHQSFGGHLNRAVVSATCEVIVEVYEGKIGRFLDEISGLNLLDI
jgi:hypothetical protein